MALSVECARVFLAAGANVNARGNRGETALHLTISRFLYGRSEDDILATIHALIVAGAEIDVADMDGVIPRQLMAERGVVVDEAKVECARRRIAKQRIDFARGRALQVCIGLRSRSLSALQTCEILQYACGPLAPLIPFHIWWSIATSVKHFKTL
jgi:hypothetical protein